MRLNSRIRERPIPANDLDPRGGGSAEVIDLTTRHVLPSVSQRKPGSDRLGLAAGVAFVALLGLLTLVPDLVRRAGTRMHRDEVVAPVAG